MTVKEYSSIRINFMYATAAELAAAERKKARLENAGYNLVRVAGENLLTGTTTMYYELEV